MLQSSCENYRSPSSSTSKDQLRIRRDDPAGPAGAVPEVGGDRQLPFAADFHAGDPFVPSFNDLPAPSVNSNGSFRSSDESNFWPFVSQPV